MVRTVQFWPPSVDLSSVPACPTHQPLFGSVNWTWNRPRPLLLLVGFQLTPPSVDLMIDPLPPTAQPTVLLMKKIWLSDVSLIPVDTESQEKPLTVRSI